MRNGRPFLPPRKFARSIRRQPRLVGRCRGAGACRGCAVRMVERGRGQGRCTGCAERSGDGCALRAAATSAATAQPHGAEPLHRQRQRRCCAPGRSGAVARRSGRIPRLVDGERRARPARLLPPRGPARPRAGAGHAADRPACGRGSAWRACCNARRKHAARDGLCQRRALFRQRATASHPAARMGCGRARRLRQAGAAPRRAGAPGAGDRAGRTRLVASCARDGAGRQSVNHNFARRW